MSYTIEWYPHLVHFHYAGQVSGEEMLQSNMDVYGDSRFDDLRWQIASFSEDAEVKVASSAIRQIAYLDRAAAKSNPNICVLLVGNRSAQNAVFETYAEHALGDTWDMLAFETLEEAFRHTGLEQRNPS